MSFRPRALSHLQVEGEHKRVSPDPSTTSGHPVQYGPIRSNGFNVSVRRMGRNYEKYIEIFTVGNCWNLLVTSSYLLVMLIWPPKDEPKRGSVPGCFVISDWNMPCPCCPTGPHRGPPGFPPGHWGEDPPQVSGKFHASPRKTPSDAIRQTSHLTSHPHFCPKSSKSCLIMSHHVSSCLIMSHHVSSCLIMSHHVSSCLFVLEMQTLGPRCKRYGWWRWWLTRPAARSKAMADRQLQDILFLYTEGLEKVYLKRS